MTPGISIEQRVKGCLLGGALGDAWGAPFEGRKGPLRFEVPTALSVSDDTLLTLAACEAILQSNAVDPARIASHFVKWFRERRLNGLGSSTLKSLRDLATGTHWALAGRRGEYAAGNGAAMRIAPLAFLLDPGSPSDRTTIRDVCRIAHHNDEAYAGALAVIAAIRSTFASDARPDVAFLAAARDTLPNCAVRDRVVELSATEITIREAAGRFGTTAYVVDTVPLALLCAQVIERGSIESVLVRAIGCGGDTDTIASITGQIAGAAAGFDALPSGPIERLYQGHSNLRIVDDFANFVAQLQRGDSRSSTMASG